MHPHLPNQTVLLPAQVEEGAHHSGYSKSRQGPSQLTKSEVPSRLSPVARLARRSRPSSVVRCCSLLLGPAQQADQITSITSIAFCSLLSFHPLLPLHPSSPVSPLSAREPAPSAGQGTRLYRTWRIIPSAQTDERPSNHQQGSRQSTAVAVQSKGCPGLAKEHHPVTSQIKSLTWSLVAVSHTRSDSLPRKVARPRATAPARQAKPSTQQQPKKTGPNPSNTLILDQGRRARRFFDRSPSPISLSASALPLNLAPGAYSNAHTFPLPHTQLPR